MIIDCYPSTFPPWDAPAGDRSLDEKMQVIQRELGGHHQPAWRVRDRSPSDDGTLVDPATGELREVTWGRHNGQLVWSYGGEVYTKQYFPPMLHNLECPPELMVAEMDYAGVDAGILHTHPHKGHYRFQNAFQRDVVTRFPDRLMRLVMVPEASIPADPDAAVAEFGAELDSGGISALQFIPRYYHEPAVECLPGNDEPWDDGAMRPFWEAVSEMGIPVFFTLIGRGPAGSSGRDPREVYLAELQPLIRWMDRYPRVKVVITHGLPWRTFLEGDRIELPESIWDVFDAPQCHMEMIIPIAMGGSWEYPWREAEAVVQECVERIGAERLMWPRMSRRVSSSLSLPRRKWAEAPVSDCQPAMAS